MVKAKRRAQGAKGKEERIFDRKEHKGHMEMLSAWRKAV